MSSPEYNDPTAHQIDYRETSDITNVHAAIQREKKEPLSESVPVPMWLMALFGLALFWGGAYMGMFSGGFSGSVYNERAGLPSAAKKGAAAAAEEAPETPVEQGKKVFVQNCAQCHQLTGMGVPSQYPPLAKSEYVNGTPKRLAMILLKGLQGPVKVEGNTFNGAMPAWEKSLNDKKISAVLTYVRQEWGNTAGEVAPEQIANARKALKDRSDSWTEANIQAVPAAAVLEGAPAAPAAAPPASAAAPAASPETKK